MTREDDVPSPAVSCAANPRRRQGFPLSGSLRSTLTAAPVCSKQTFAGEGTNKSYSADGLQPWREIELYRKPYSQNS